MNKVVIDGVDIGRGCAPYVVAELSANHNGSLERALQTIESAKQMGASAIKLQTYSADTMTIDCDKPEFQINGGLWDGYKLYDLYREAQTPFDWHKAMFDHANKLGVTCFSTPFDESAVDLLESLNAPAYKIASFEAIDLPLIRYAAKTGKPMIISTGMANLEEITEAVDAAKTGGCRELILLHCISSYPAPASQSNLATIMDLEKRFDVVVGLSDHTLGTTVSVASVALGAAFIEKHYTLSRQDKGPDSEFSLEPHELQQLCSDCRTSWEALGQAGYERKPAEEANMVFRRSLYFVDSLQAGETIQAHQVRRIRPGYGLAPKFYDQIIGRTVKTDITPGTAVQWGLLND